MCIRPRRWIVTIPSLDQWLATIGNHWKTIVSNGKTIEKPLVPMVCQTQNHWKTIVSNGKTIEKPIGTNGWPDQNHWKNIVSNRKTIGKPSLPMVCQTKNHWYQWLLSNHSSAQVSMKTLKSFNYKVNKSCVGITNNLTINIIKYLKLVPSSVKLSV